MGGTCARSKSWRKCLTLGEGGGGGGAVGGQALLATNLSLSADAADAKGRFLNIFVLERFFLMVTNGLLHPASEIVKVTFGFQVSFLSVL